MALWRNVVTVGDYRDVNFNEEIVLQTNENREYIMPRAAIALSKLLTELLQGSAEEGEEQQTMIPLANVDSATFEVIADYLTHYIPPVTPTPVEKPMKGPLKELLPAWEQDYVYNKLLKDNNEKDHELLFKTLLAANFLGVDPLRDLCCAATANMLCGKTEEQIMELFNVKGPKPTPEQLKELEVQYPWLSETNEGTTESTAEGTTEATTDEPST